MTHLVIYCYYSGECSRNLWLHTLTCSLQSQFLVFQDVAFKQLARDLSQQMQMCCSSLLVPALPKHDVAVYLWWNGVSCLPLPPLVIRVYKKWKYKCKNVYLVSYCTGTISNRNSDDSSCYLLLLQWWVCSGYSSCVHWLASSTHDS
jgi:hypothetical protein